MIVMFPIKSGSRILGFTYIIWMILSFFVAFQSIYFLFFGILMTIFAFLCFDPFSRGQYEWTLKEDLKQIKTDNYTMIWVILSLMLGLFLLYIIPMQVLKLLNTNN